MWLTDSWWFAESWHFLDFFAFILRLSRYFVLICSSSVRYGSRPLATMRFQTFVRHRADGRCAPQQQFALDMFLQRKSRAVLLVDELFKVAKVEPGRRVVGRLHPDELAGEAHGHADHLRPLAVKSPDFLQRGRRRSPGWQWPVW